MKLIFPFHICINKVTYMEPDENKIESVPDSKKIDKIIKRSNTQSRILKKVLTQLKKDSKSLESEEVETSKKSKK